MAEGKNHRDTLNLIQSELENPPFNLRCKKEVDVIRKGFHRIDLICINPSFDNSKNISYDISPIVALELETNSNFDIPQIRSNAEDLRAISSIYPQAKVLHFHVSKIPDFKKELIKEKSNCSKNLEGKCIIENLEKENKSINKEKKIKAKLGLPKRINLNW